MSLNSFAEGPVPPGSPVREEASVLGGGHRILRIVWAMIKSGRPSREGGPDYFVAASKEQVKEQLVRRLQTLWSAVTVEAPAA